MWFGCGFSWCWLCVYDVDMNLGVFVVVCCGFLVLVVLTGGFVVFATYMLVGVRLALGFVFIWVLMAYLMFFCATFVCLVVTWCFSS